MHLIVFALLVTLQSMHVAYVLQILYSIDPSLLVPLSI